MGKVSNDFKSTSRRLFVVICTLFLPQKLKRILLIKLLNYRIKPTAYIGFSLIYPKQLIMNDDSRIGHLTLCKGLSLLHIKEHSRIENLNWITAVQIEAEVFKQEKGRKPQLILGAHSAITNRHLIDCCNSVEIGSFSTFAGFRSQILTHAIDLNISKQSSAGVTIGDYCFVGTNVVFLPGSSLPSYSVLAASACLTESFSDDHTLYGGVPAKPIKKLDADLCYFNREQGFVL